MTNGFLADFRRIQETRGEAAILDHDTYRDALEELVKALDRNDFQAAGRVMFFALEGAMEDLTDQIETEFEVMSHE